MPIYANNNNDNDILNENIKFRIHHGLNSDPEYVRDIIKNSFKNYAELFAMSSEEIDILTSREKNIPLLHDIKDEIFKNYNDIFAGMYYDPSTGQGVIMLTESRETIKNEILNKHNFDLRFEYVDFSYQELIETSDKVKEFLGSYGINAFFLNEMENNIELLVASDLDTQEIHKDLKDILNFSHLNIKLGQINDLSLWPGDGIKKSGSSGYDCSVGFKARDSDGEDVLVTAGHCDNTVGRIWTDLSNNQIGTWKQEATSNVDSGTIKLTTYMSAGSIRTAVSDEFVGQTIYKKGAHTGTTWGPYQGEYNCYINSDGYTICNSGKVNALAGGGDSGGMVYTNYIGDGGGYNLKGTVNGGFPDDGIYLYSRVNNIFNTLNLQAIYIE